MRPPTPPNKDRSTVLTLIAAMAENRVIGRDGGLPWHLPTDLAHFKRRTTGHTMIMGRRTFDSVGIPLPNRRSIVISRDPSRGIDGAEVVGSLEAAIDRAAAGPDEELFVTGGGAIYRLALPRADRLDLTIVHTEIDGDTTFPAFEDDATWVLTSEERHPADERHSWPFTFRVYDRAR